MASTAVEKTEEELRKEIEELYRQQREITERLRDPRGLRRGGGGGFSGTGPRNFAPNGARPRGFVRPADHRTDSEDQPAPKRRLSSAVVKVEDGQITEDDKAENGVEQELVADDSGEAAQVNRRAPILQQPSRSREAGNKRADFEAPAVDHVPRVLPKDQHPSTVNRNKRMLGQLLGTLEKFRKEDMHLSGSEAFMRKSSSLQRAEQRAREESERLRQQEREQIAEKRKRDLTLKARVAAKAEEKKLELLFLQWSEHQKKLCNFQRTKAEPPIYYSFNKPLDNDENLVKTKRDLTFEEWKTARREELSQYQKQLAELYIANVEKGLERWSNARKGRKANNETLNLQETMDKELETHRLEHGPKTRKILSGGNNDDDDDDVEDINAAEDDMLDDVLGVDENGQRVEEATSLNPGNASPHLLTSHN